MHATSSLAQKLAHNYPELKFAEDPYAHWSPASRTVYYDPHEPHAEWILLHEAAHGLLSHQDYIRDIELLTMERHAWHYAAAILAPQFDITIDEEFIEHHIDTYRDWLHAKSTCPSCQSTGYEAARQRYSCLHCGVTWHTNTGIDTQIRRFATT